MKQILAAGSVLLVFLLAPGLTAQTSGSVAVGAQADSTSGNVSAFQEQNGGEESGVFIERLKLLGTGTVPWQIDGRFSTGGSGWLDLSARDGAWSGGLRLTQARTWSATSFADDALPSGVPVSSLSPPSTTLDPLFGVTDPHGELLHTEAWLTRAIGNASRLTVRAGYRQRDGSRVPNIGAFSFSDVGTPAFFAPGLERIDSSSSWGALEATSLWRGLALQLDAGASRRDNRTRYDLPAYGTSGLLDLNRWTTGTEADSRWFRLAASRPSERVTVYGGVSWIDVSSTPSGSDLRVTGNGDVVRDGLSLENGSIDATTSAGAAGFTWRMHPAVALTVSADVQSRSSEGSGRILLRSANPVFTTTDTSSDRVGATADLTGRFGATRVHLRGRVTTTNIDRLEDSTPFLQDETRSIDRMEIRGDLSRRLSGDIRARGWVRYADESGSVDLRQLDYGYASSDWDRDDLSGGIELALGSGDRRANLTVNGGKSDVLDTPPLFDPVYDPSLELSDIGGTISTFRAAVTGMRNFARGTAWGEAGWLSTEYEYNASFDQPGFSSMSEKIEGLVASAGAEVRPRDGTRVIGQVEWVRDRADLDRTLTRASLELAQTIHTRFELFGRWFVGDLDAPHAQQSNYSVNLFAVGVRTNF
ncbi:MAG TPA: hypothetical protein VF958_08545 [Thermoanaerobaculia bacterium]